MIWQVISAFGVLGTVVFGILALRRENRKENKADGMQSGSLMTEIGYIKGGVDDIKRKQDRLSEQHIEVVTRLTAVEESAKSAHKRIDSLEKK